MPGSQGRDNWKISDRARAEWAGTVRNEGGEGTGKAEEGGGAQESDGSTRDTETPDLQNRLEQPLSGRRGAVES